MSGDGSLTLWWGDGEHVFRLRIGELRELQEKRDAGAFQICMRLNDGTWRIDDIIETLRLGLIGGGAAAPLALGLVAKYAGPTTFAENAIYARNVLAAALFGVPDDPVGKATAETAPTMAIPPSTGTPANSGSRLSSEMAPQWDGHRGRSTPVPSGNSPPPLTDGAGRTVPTTSRDQEE
jgi:hypothetical protein